MRIVDPAKAPDDPLIAVNDLYEMLLFQFVLRSMSIALVAKYGEMSQGGEVFLR